MQGVPLKPLGTSHLHGTLVGPHVEVLDADLANSLPLPPGKR